MLNLISHGGNVYNYPVLITVLGTYITVHTLDVQSDTNFMSHVNI